MTAPSPIPSRKITVKDEDLAEFHLLPEFAHRIPGRDWELDCVTLSMDVLYCPYPDPGGAHSPPAGFMGGVAWGPGQCAGRRIVDLAAAIATAIESGKVDGANVALNRILDFRKGGVGLIHSQQQLMAVVQINGYWYVREGMHRAVALALLGEPQLEAVNFSSARQAPA